MPNDATVGVSGRTSGVPAQQNNAEGHAWISSKAVRITVRVAVGTLVAALIGGVFMLLNAHFSSVDSRFNQVNSQFQAQTSRMDSILESVATKDDVSASKDDVLERLDRMEKHLLSIEEFLRNGAGSGVQRD